MFSNQRWYIVGITSYGQGCASPYYPGVYTRVSIYDNVIKCFLKNQLSCIKRKFIIRNSVSSSFVSFYMINVLINLGFVVRYFLFC